MLRFLFPVPPSVLVVVMSVISFTTASSLGLSEVRGKHVEYSKFSNSQGDEKQLPSRVGMLVGYTPALIVSLASFAFLENSVGPRNFLLSLALSIHFLKRVLEVLFVHQYSGKMGVNSVRSISSGYLISALAMIYAQQLTRGTVEPAIDLKRAGVVLFLVGIVGNFYHHCLLSKLREKGEKQEYKIPKGGLFGLVICPHYLFEIIGFVGVSFISQTVYAFSFTLGSMLYLMGRSYATQKWYISKFRDFPVEVKALIPYVL